MEQTEIEKKAEEYIMREDVVTENDRVPVDNGYGWQTVSFEDEVKRAYIDGLAEGKPKWHDLRKNPGDLPDNGRCVIVKDKSRKEYDIACLCRSKPDSDFWSYERFTTRVNDNYVVAWCELPKFEE